MNRLILPALCAVALAACSFHAPPQPRYFVLDPGRPPSMRALQSPPATATVSFVDVAAPFASDGFVYQTSDHHWEVDPYNQFLVSPADMMTSVLRNWTRSSGLFGSVAEAGAGGGQEYYIDCDLAELYGDFRNPLAPTATLTLDVQVFHQTDKGRLAILRQRFTRSVPVASRTPAALADAWNEALRVELNQLLRTLGEMHP